MPAAYESFNKADSAVLGPNHVWTKDTAANSAAMSVVANQLGGTAGNGLRPRARCDVTLDSGDHYAEMQVHVLADTAVGGAAAGVMVRATTTGTALSDYYLFDISSDGTYDIERMVGGTLTSLRTNAALTIGALPGLMRLEVEGSTLRAYWKGALLATLTDTALPASAARQSAGIELFQPNGSTRVDEFRADVLAAPVAPPSPTLRRFTAEGQPPGTALTVANSGTGSGSPLQVVALTAPGTAAYSAAAAAHGAQSIAVEGSTDASRVILGFGGFDSPEMALALYLNLNAAPTASTNIAQLRSATAAGCQLVVDTARQVRVTNAAGAVLHTFPTPLATKAWWRLELRAVRGTTTANGTVQAAVYAEDATTPVDPVFTTSTANVGTANWTDARYGKVAGGVLSALLDTLSADVDRGAFIGPMATPLALLLSGGLTPSGRAARDAVLAPAGSVAPAGAFASLRVVARRLTGALAPLGALTRGSPRLLTASLRPVGSRQRVPLLRPAGAVRPAAVLRHLPAKRPAGQLAPRGSLLTTAVGRLFGQAGGVWVRLAERVGEVRIRLDL